MAFAKDLTPNQNDTFTPLYNRDAECSLIGGMLTTKSVVALDAMFTQLVADDFYIELNRAIFQKGKTAFDDGKEIDIVTIADSLTRDGMEHSVYSMVQTAPVSITPLVTLVKDLAVRRQVQAAGRDLITLASNHSLPTNQVVSDASQLAFDITGGRVNQELNDSSDAVDEAMAEMERRMVSTDPHIGISSGYSSYNLLMGGFHETNFTILAARPAMGKTALALNFAARQAVVHNIPVSIFSIEMSKQQLIFRLFAQVARIDNERLKMGKLTDDEYERLKIAAARIKKAPLYITDRPQTLSSICASTRRAVRKHGVRQVYVDYLQLITLGKSVQSREREVTTVAEGLKELAKSANVNVCALAQLNRGLEDREDKRPLLSDLRESGGIEQAADEVLVLYRPSVYYDDADERETELIVRKHRNGALGMIPLMWSGPNFRFDELDMRHVNTPSTF